MHQDRLRAACEERLDELNLPHRFSTGDLRNVIAERSGRRIELRPMPQLTRRKLPCGLYVRTPTADVLLCEKSTSQNHQLHILAHELSHVLCEHRGWYELDPGQAQTLGFDPVLVKRMIGRAGHTTDDEREAETMATVIRQRIHRGRVLPPLRPRDTGERWDAFFGGSPAPLRSAA